MFGPVSGGWLVFMDVHVWSYRYAGVNPHSQAAYDLAAQGLVRPEDGHTKPMIYNIRCIDFQLPDFTLG